MISLMNICCSYFLILVTSLMYNAKSQSQFLPVWFCGLTLIAGFAVFFLAYGMKEQEWLNIISKADQEQQNKHLERLGKLGKFVGFFFDHTGLMLKTVAVKLYESIRLLDYVFMLVMMQTHPYWKGLFVSRIRLLCWTTLGCFSAFALNQFVFVKLINSQNSGKYMKVVSLLSIALYPAMNTLIASVGFRKPGWVVFAYFFAEFIKFLALFMMREGLFETINDTKSKNKKEKYRALGFFVESFFKFFSILVLGSIIVKFMKSMYIQQMNPWNYLISFLILCLPLVGVFFLLMFANISDHSA